MYLYLESIGVYIILYYCREDTCKERIRSKASILWPPRGRCQNSNNGKCQVSLVCEWCMSMLCLFEFKSSMISINIIIKFLTYNDNTKYDECLTFFLLTLTINLFLSIIRHYPSEEEFLETNEKIKRGDIVGVRGKPGRCL